MLILFSPHDYNLELDYKPQRVLTTKGPHPSHLPGLGAKFKEPPECQINFSPPPIFRKRGKLGDPKIKR